MHKPEVKAKVAMTAIQGELTIAEMVKKFNVQAAQKTKWKRCCSAVHALHSTKAIRLLRTMNGKSWNCGAVTAAVVAGKRAATICT